MLELAYINGSSETGIRSPLDTAILVHARFDLSAWHKLDEIPFDFERRRLSIVVEHEGQRLLITKGAPESVLAKCTGLEHGSTSVTPGQVQALDSVSGAACEKM